MQSSVLEMSKITYPVNCSIAVYIKDLCKSYNSADNGKEVVLNKFCMRVKKDSIYGFLGSSGCGKTTVLSCLVGLKTWDSGRITVFGKKLLSKESGISGKSLGYMPQDLALYNHLSIFETMTFYGRLYDMPDSVIRKQWEVISELLNLSNGGSKIVGELSGGQKRRVSLAVALIHSPQLLVLDEPTVGLDPVLRENIWNYLYQIAGKLGTTIIITTHYIEEARYSDTIGLMRRGRMIVEESPAELMKYYESDLLEQVVLEICKLNQLKTENPTDTLESYKSDKFKSSWQQNNDQSILCDGLEGQFHVLPSAGDIHKSYQPNQSLKNKFKLKYSNIHQFLSKTCGFTRVILLILFRHPVFLMLILMLPAIQATIALFAIGSKPIGLPFGIVNHEVGDWINHSCIRNELVSKNLLTAGLDLKLLSCQFLDELRKDKLVNLISIKAEEDAHVQVELGSIWGYVIIPENFSQSFTDLLIARQYALNDSIEGSKIPIHLDYSQSIASLFIIRSIYKSYWNFMTGLAKSFSIDEKMVEIPLKFRKPIYGDNEDNYTAFVMPGGLLYTIYGIICAISSLLLIEDRRQGTLSRATVAGLSCSNVLISHVIVQGFLTIIQLAVMSIVQHFIFSIPINGQIWLYTLICLLTGLSASALGIFLGLTLSTEVKVLYIGAFLSQLFLFAGGIIWPTEAITQIWQIVGNILPTCLPTLSLRSVVIRGVGIGHPTVWPGILASIFWTIGLIIFSVKIYLKRE